jgi:mRNA interferase YafQ
MKREAIFRKQFRKDLERIKRTGSDTTRLLEVIELLTNHQPLPPNSRDHQLIGNLKDYRECHLGGDWLLIYQLSNNTVSVSKWADILFQMPM